MPNNTVLTKSQLDALSWLHRFFDALEEGDLAGLLKSDELRRFIH